MENRTIFNNYLELDCWCYDVIEEWIAYRKNKGKSYTQDDWDEYLQEYLMIALSSNFEDCLENEDD